MDNNLVKTIIIGLIYNIILFYIFNKALDNIEGIVDGEIKRSFDNDIALRLQKPLLLSYLVLTLQVLFSILGMFGFILVLKVFSVRLSLLGMAIYLLFVGSIGKSVYDYQEKRNLSKILDSNNKGK